MGTIPVQPSHASDAVDHNKQCIFCLEEKPLTIEHVFPESIGGRLKIPFVCKDCNSKLGSTVDGKFQALFPFILNRQIYGLKGKKGHCPNIFSGVWAVDDPTSRLKKVRIVNGSPETLPTVTIKEDLDATSVSMVIPATYSRKEQLEMVKKELRRVQLKLNPQLEDAPDKLNKLVASMADEALQKATHHSERPLLHQEKIAWNDTGVQEYVKIAYELAFCMYGYPYILKSDSARSFREAIFSGGVALRKLHYVFPISIPAIIDPFPDRELFFWIGDGIVFVRMFGFGGCIKVLTDAELADFPPIDTYLSKLVANSPDVQKDDARCLWGQKLVKGQPPIL